MVKKDLTGFIAEFPNDNIMMKKLQQLGVNIPPEWTPEKSNFSVITDMGRELELAFWNPDKDQQVGEETFIVDYEDVYCWA